VNLSGEAVQKLPNSTKSTSSIWVISDDLDLPFGRLRLRVGGGAGGHNGLKSTIVHLGDGFVRARLGIGHNAQIPSEHYVLQAFPKDESEQLPKFINAASDLIVTRLSDNSIQPTSFDLL
jgi:PTH1 family peptidyl-tRNA hydrolase